MEFNEKLQNLRKQKGLTQEELAQALFVSRTAVSKWESGRGYPNIDSLKGIAEFFGLTVDQLLSGDELLTIAQVDGKQKESHLRDLVFGLLDCSVMMLFFLPFFAQKVDGAISSVPLISLGGVSSYLTVGYYFVVIVTLLTGIATLALQNCRCTLWAACKGKLSVALGAVGGVLFTVSLQPYAATLLFVFLAIKVMMLIKW